MVKEFNQVSAQCQSILPTGSNVGQVLILKMGTSLSIDLESAVQRESGVIDLPTISEQTVQEEKIDNF